MRSYWLLAIWWLCNAPAAWAEMNRSDGDAAQFDGYMQIENIKLPDAASRQAIYHHPFQIRADRIATGAKLEMDFLAEEKLAKNQTFAGIRILINGALVAEISQQQVSRQAKQLISIPARSLADNNSLVLELLGKEGCAVALGSWSSIKSARLLVQSEALPLPNDLALLPLPFVDRHLDQQNTVAMVLDGEPNAQRIRLASLVASWLGSISGIPLRFTVYFGGLPGQSAIVLTDNPVSAALMGLPAPEGPAARMIDHPGAERAAKLLLVQGRNLAELELAVRGLTTQSALGGAVANFGALASTAPTTAPLGAYAAARWRANERPIPLVEDVEHPLAHEGTRDGTIAARFRVAPDLWIWPSEWFFVDVRYRLILPPGVKAPRLDVAFNGQFVGQLSAPKPAEGETERVGGARLRLHSTLLHGFNELMVYVKYDSANCESLNDAARVELTADSAIHLEGLPHFASLPDLSLFVNDGFPFTRIPDLGETAVVVSARPRPAEISALLSAMAHFAAVTGQVGSRITVIADDELEDIDVAQKDLLIIGLFDELAVLKRWAARFPINIARGQAGLQIPNQANRILDFAALKIGQGELRRAEDVLGRNPRFAALVGAQSPLNPHRSVVVLSGSNPSLMPALNDLQGFAVSRQPAGDLLIAANGSRWMFQIGPSYGVGECDRWTKILWFLACHCGLLLPFAFGGALVIAVQIRKQINTRIARRLSENEGAL